MPCYLIVKKTAVAQRWRKHAFYRPGMVVKLTFNVLELSFLLDVAGISAKAFGVRTRIDDKVIFYTSMLS